MSASPWMTLPEACDYTRHSRQTVRRAAVEYQRDNSKGLRGYQPHTNASWRFHVTDLDRWVRGEPPARSTRQLASVRTA
jgi:hypothetical protein